MLDGVRRGMLDGKLHAPPSREYHHFIKHRRVGIGRQQMKPHVFAFRRALERRPDRDPGPNGKAMIRARHHIQLILVTRSRAHRSGFYHSPRASCQQ